MGFWKPNAANPGRVHTEPGKRPEKGPGEKEPRWVLLSQSTNRRIYKSEDFSCWALL